MEHNKFKKIELKTNTLSSILSCVKNSSQTPNIRLKHLSEKEQNSSIGDDHGFKDLGTSHMVKENFLDILKKKDINYKHTSFTKYSLNKTYQEQIVALQDQIILFKTYFNKREKDFQSIKITNI